MEKNCYLKPARTHNGSIKTDMPLMVFPKARKRRLVATIGPGQLCCVGKVYLKTKDGLIRIR